MGKKKIILKEHYEGNGLYSYEINEDALKVRKATLPEQMSEVVEELRRLIGKGTKPEKKDQPAAP